MRFFGTNYLFKNFGGTYVASSNDDASYLMFNEEKSYSWISDGAASDSTEITVTRTLSFSIDIDRIFIRNTNIADLEIKVDVGAGLVALSSASTFTLYQSEDETCYFFVLDNSITITEIQILGSETITADEEKEIQQILAFEEICQIENCDDVDPTKVYNQVISKLLGGKSDIINRGTSYSVKIKFKNHAIETDNDSIALLRDRTAELWLWLNDNNEASMRFIQEPFRFQDIFKVAQKGNHSASYDKNYWQFGTSLTLTYDEVA